MAALGNYLLSGRLQAVLSVFLLTLLSLLLPLFVYPLSGGAAALLLLRKGPRGAAEALIPCALLLALVAPQIGIEPLMALSFVAVVWLPVCVCCCVLRVSESQGYAALEAGLLVAAGVVGIHWLVGDVPAWWLEHLQALSEDVFPEQYRQLLEQMAPAINAMVAGSMVISVMIAVLIGRWWQALLFNPGGFKKEFYALNLPWAIVFLLLAGIIFTSIGNFRQGTVGMDMLVVTCSMCFFQGLSWLHRTVAKAGASAIWLALVYMLLLLSPQIILLFLACLGLADSWLRRYANSGE